LNQADLRAGAAANRRWAKGGGESPPARLERSRFRRGDEWDFLQTSEQRDGFSGTKSGTNDWNEASRSENGELMGNCKNRDSWWGVDIP